MIKINKNRIKEYLTTLIVSMVVVILLALCVELDLLFNCEKIVNTRELDISNLLEFCKIEQLEKRLKREPKNYVVAIKLAKSYEKLEEYSKANNLYADALKLSSRSPYSIYSYAMFLSRRSIYGMSMELAEELTLQNKKTLEYKAQIYEEIAKTLRINKEFEGEVKAYQVAQKYAKNIKDDEYLDKINTAYADAYVHLADYNVEKGDVASAILNLENSLKIKELDSAKYKLGIIYQNTDKVKAEKLLSEVLNSNPFLINPYIYNKLLNDLINESKYSMNSHSVDFYTLRLNKLKKVMQNNYVYRNEISIEKSHITEFKKLLSKNKNYSLYFDLKNNTKFSINKLYIQIEIFINNKQYLIKKQIVNALSPLSYYDTIKQITIELPSDFAVNDIKKQNDVIIKYYAKKRLKAPWTLIKIESFNF